MSVNVTKQIKKLGKAKYAFQYTMSCPTWKLLKNAKISSITFEISQYRYEMTLHFLQPIKISQAVHRVEKWLSIHVTDEYLSVISDDIPSHKKVSCRGDCVGHRFLEEVALVVEDGKVHATLVCGS